jgi:hypothetical protein
VGLFWEVPQGLPILPTSSRGGPTHTNRDHEEAVKFFNEVAKEHRHFLLSMSIKTNIKQIAKGYKVNSW